MRRFRRFRRALAIATLLLIVTALVGHAVLAWRYHAAASQYRALGYPVTWDELLADYNRKTTPNDVADVYQAAFVRYAEKEESDLPIVGESPVPPPGELPDEALAVKIKAYLAKNADAIAMLRDAAVMPRAQFRLVSPVTGADIEYDLDVSKHLRQAARLFALDALQAEADGDIGRAIDDVECCYRFARHRSESPNAINLLVGIAIEGIGSEAGARVLHGRHVDVDTVFALHNKVPEPDPEDELRNAFRGEFVRWMTLFAGPDISAGQVGGNLLSSGYLSEETVEYLSTEYPWLLFATGHLGRATGVIKLHEIHMLTDATQYARAYAAPFAFVLQTPPHTASGDPVSEDNFAVQDGVPIAVALSAVRTRLLRAACVIKKHQLETGKYPAKLEEMANEFQRDDLEDSFAGAPFRYVTTETGVKLYSLGRNRVDDGGNATRYADITISL